MKGLNGQKDPSNQIPEFIKKGEKKEQNNQIPEFIKVISINKAIKKMKNNFEEKVYKNR